MTLTNAHPLTKTRSRRTALGLALRLRRPRRQPLRVRLRGRQHHVRRAGPKDKSTDEVIELFKDAAAEEEDDEEVQAAVDAVDDFDDTQKDAFADALKAECEGEDDDTKLGDL